MSTRRKIKYMLDWVPNAETRFTECPHVSESFIPEGDPLGTGRYQATCPRTKDLGLGPVSIDAPRVRSSAHDDLVEEMSRLACRGCEDYYRMTTQEVAELQQVLAEARLKTALADAAAAAAEAQLAQNDLDNRLGMVTQVNEMQNSGQITPQQANLFTLEIMNGI